MARLVTEHELKGIGTHVRKQAAIPAARRLRELLMPALIVIGENDLPYLKLAADFMAASIPNTAKVVIPNAGHLPNMERPALFQDALRDFLGNC